MLDNFQGSLLLSQKDEFLFKHHAGFAKPGITIVDRTLFRTASVTKPIVAATFLKLCHEKEISLESPLSKILPHFKAAWAHKVTLFQMLSHQSGIGRYEDMPGAGELLKSHKPIEEIITFIEKSDLVFEPGTNYLYSPPGYLLLGEVIEEISGLKINHFFKRYVFDPLEMGESFFALKGTLDDIAHDYGHLALAYTQQGNDIVHIPSRRNIVFSGCSGAIVSSLNDLHVWCQAFLTGELLPTDLQQLMLTPNRNHYGLGINVERMKDFQIFYHKGYAEGSNTIILMIPKKEIILIVLSNNKNLMMDKIVTHILAEYAGLEVILGS